ncbi:hypothetical protein [Brevundimonas sp.]|uniref:hypothetical protein n=1 Tax=Brevundimonas sp. TaxID=1871086 RepID=UPI0025BF4544|nr:hypothetical protein [Brevundimonas sp.]
MSVDEYDPMIERLFAKTTPLPDEALFAAEVAVRMEKRSRWRALALTSAGVIGGVFAVREGMRFNFDGAGNDATTVSQSVRAVAITAQGATQNGLDGLGIGSIDLMSGSGMLAFWIVAGALFALLAAGAVKLSQDV